jgi:hypothetical protein
MHSLNKITKLKRRSLPVPLLRVPGTGTIPASHDTKAAVQEARRHLLSFSTRIEADIKHTGASEDEENQCADPDPFALIILQ